MRYGWVNQNQTYRYEMAGGYLWSPETEAQGVFGIQGRHPSPAPAQHQPHKRKRSG